MGQHGPIRLTLTTRLVLASLYQHAGPNYPYEIAKGCALDVNIVLGSLHRLESAELVHKTSEPPETPPQGRGRPRVWFELTPEGRDFAAQTIETTQQMVRAQARTIGLTLG